jgi:hypothetical protein
MVEEYIDEPIDENAYVSKGLTAIKESSNECSKSKSKSTIHQYKKQASTSFLSAGNFNNSEIKKSSSSPMIATLMPDTQERYSTKMLVKACSSITGFNKSLIHDYNESVTKKTSRNKEEMRQTSAEVGLKNYTSGVSKTQFDIKNLTGRYTN